MAFVTSLLTSCDNKEVDYLQINLNDVHVSVYSEQVSQLSSHLGIHAIHPSRISKDKMLYQFSGQLAQVNSDEFNPNTKKFIIIQISSKVHEVYFRDSQVKVQTCKDTKEIYVIHNNRSIKLQDFDFEEHPQYIENDILTLLVLYNEMTNLELNRDEHAHHSLKSISKTCKFIALGFDSTRSLAKARAGNVTEKWLKSHPDCSVTGDYDSACLWGDFGCLSARSIICTGKTCK